MGIVVGIDPGLCGGIAVLDTNKDKFVRVSPLPVTAYKKGRFELDLDSFIQLIDDICSKNQDSSILCAVEQPPVIAKGKLALASLFRNFGEIRGVLRSRKLSMCTPLPQTWKGEVLRGTDKSKEAAISYVKMRFPEVDLFFFGGKGQPHDGIAEACCLAEYGRRSSLSRES